MKNKLKDFCFATFIIGMIIVFSPFVLGFGIIFFIISLLLRK